MAGLFASEAAARIWFEALVREVACRRPDGRKVTISLGWCIAEAEENMSAQLSRADHALYQAKHGGKNRAVRAVSGGPRMIAVA